jgi:hypothetical protein
VELVQACLQRMADRPEALPPLSPQTSASVLSGRIRRARCRPWLVSISWTPHLTTFRFLSIASPSQSQSRNSAWGIPRSPFFENLHPEVAEAINAAIEDLRKLTAQISDTTVPAAFQLVPRIIGREAYAEALHQTNLLRQEIIKTFENVDLLITPTVPDPAETLADAKSFDPPPRNTSSGSQRSLSPASSLKTRQRSGSGKFANFLERRFRPV